MRNHILILLVCFYNISYSQENIRREIIPPAPNAASLGKYGDVPVSLYTGIPQITIPLYEIKNKEFTLPVSLSYHAGGVKVEEVASAVGVSWSLNAGGVITRTIRGLPDEFGYSRNFPNNDGDKVYGFNQLSDVDKREFLHNVTQGAADNEPDVYFFNFDGRSGKIIFDRRGSPVIVPYQKLKITGNYNEGFLITTEDGTKYAFYSPETTETFTTPASDIDESHTSSWYLSYINYPNGRSVGFTYDQNLIKYQPHRSETWYDRLNAQMACEATMRQAQIIRSETQALRLIEINSENVAIKFKYINSRNDLEGDKSLDSMMIENRRGDLIKKISFTYNQTEWGRLRLDRVQEIGSNATIPPYNLFYNGSPPPINSFAQDHWGFYNGATTQTTLIPRTDDWPIFAPGFNLEGADRNPTVAARSGILSKVCYPTGGCTVFDYEPNDYGYVNGTPQEKREMKDTSASISANPLEYNTSPLTIGDIQEVTIRYGYTRDYPGDPGSSFEAIITLFNKTSNQYYFQRLVTSDGESQKVLLHPGEYELGVEASGDRRTTAYMAYKKSGRILHHLITGGLRIKRITNYTDASSNATVRSLSRYLYRMPEDTTRSSGVMGILPMYHYQYDMSVSKNNEPTPIPCAYLVRKSGSVSLGSTQGSHVGYQVVTVQQDEDGSNGKQVNEYTTFKDSPDVYLGGFGFPFAPETSNDNRRGLLKKQITYAKTSSGYDTLRKIVNYYTFDSRNKKTVLTFTAGVRAVSAVGPTLYAIDSAKYISEWSYLSRKVDYTYAAGNVQKSVVDFFYDNPQHIQLTKTKQTLAERDTLLTFYKYPLDYHFNAGNGAPAIALKKMQEDHIVSRVIESHNWRKKDIETEDDSVFLSADFSTYKVTPNNKVMVDSVYKLTSNAGAATSFSESRINASGTLLHDKKYRTDAVFSKYDIYGNIAELRTSDGLITSYVWGYAGTLPTAEASNAMSNEIFHTSFEDEANGNTAFKTGTRSHLGFFSLPMPAKAGSYKLSYWHKQISDVKWTYHEEVLVLSQNTPNKIIGANNVLIDEVRVCPLTSQMRTFTHKPGVGILSVTDSNNMSVYYVYDSLGRLIRTLDDDRNVTKIYSYHYKK